jgi:hypothetical protein
MSTAFFQELTGIGFFLLARFDRKGKRGAAVHI